MKRLVLIAAPVLAVGVAVLAWNCDCSAPTDPAQSATTAAAARTADPEAVYGKSLDWLLKTQHDNGGFGQIPGQPPGEVGITGLVIKGLAMAPEPFQAKARPAAEKAVGFLLKHQQEDGSFTQQRSGLSTYRTAIAISALSSLDRTKYQAAIDKATAWLKSDQFDAEEKVGEDSPYYGGFGYDKGGEKPDADMSNTLMALSALKDAGVSPDDPVYQRALKFLSRCQNNSETNPAVGGLRPKNDGGFIYDPGLDRNKSSMTEHEDGSRSFESYASMTYGGLMSLIYSGLKKDDARVKAALGWISKNYTLEENYGLGIRAKDPKVDAQQGLYYYYHVFAKALAATGDPVVPTASGERYWAQDLVDALGARQKPDGMLVNENSRWWEKDPVLVTAYSLNALNHAWPYLPKSQ
jgi:squalene-hopene/tetraprenyl-beta-curcumene cyclase